MSGNGSAFPFEQVTQRDYGTPSKWVNHTGLTKRELFAAMAMQGSLGGAPGPHLRYEELARDSVRHADALLAELAKEPQP